MDTKENEWVAGYDAAIADLAAFVKSRRFADEATEAADTIGSRIRVAREASGLSQKDLAALMVDKGFKWSQTAVWSLESDDRRLTAAEVVPLANAIGVSALYLLGEQA